MNKALPTYPYLPKGKTFSFVPLENAWMQKAQQVAQTDSGCSWWQTGAVIVKDEELLGKGANTGQWQPFCPRYEQGCKTGEGYDLCKNICKQTGHAEITAIQDAITNKQNLRHADLYLFGHWWCCKNCWNAIIAQHIQCVYLLKNAHNIFTRENRIIVMKKIAADKKHNRIPKKEDLFWNMS